MNSLLRLGTVLLFVVLYASCENPKSKTALKDHEKAKMILALEETKLVVSELAWNLDEPWEITWGPDNHLWVTQHKGRVKRVNPATGVIKEVLYIPHVYFGRTTGLLSMVLHPDFKTNPFVYLHYTYVDSTGTETDKSGKAPNVKSKIVRYRYFPEADTLKNEEAILPNIPGSGHHNGSRMTVTTDKKIIFAIGDAGHRDAIYDKNALVGKVLRLNLDGSVPDDNPVPGKYVYSMGHRNPQGVVAANGKIYASEHGPNNDDELNLIQPNANYGWPFVEGYCDTENELKYCDSTIVTEPIYAWTPTIAPAGLDYYDHTAIPEWRNSLLLTTLKGRSLQQLQLDESGEAIVNEKFYLQKQFGRFRDLCVSPSGDVYLITSNSDWHINRNQWMYDNVPEEGNDRIIKLSPVKSEEFAHLHEIQEDSAQIDLFIVDNVDYSIPGNRLYIYNCATCHRPNGLGTANGVPPLVATELMTDRNRLIETTLNGQTGKITVKGQEYDGVMPGFAASLNDTEIAELLNYIVIHLNNRQEEKITPEEVSEIRQKIR